MVTGQRVILCIWLPGFKVRNLFCINQILNFMLQSRAIIGIMPYDLVEFTVEGRNKFFLINFSRTLERGRPKFKKFRGCLKALIYILLLGCPTVLNYTLLLNYLMVLVCTLLLELTPSLFPDLPSKNLFSWAKSNSF